MREPAWHGLGNVLDDYPTDWDDARKKAGLTWEPQTVPAYVRMPEPQLVPTFVCGNTDCKAHAGVVIDGNVWECVVCGTKTPPIMSEYVEVEGKRIVVRDDTHAALGVVSDGYSLVSHKQMGEIAQALLDAGEGSLKFETAGSLKGGANVYLLVYLDEPATIAGDDTETYPYLALTNAHDGSGALRAMFTSVRIVCWNTYSAAEAAADKRGGNLLTFRHTGDMAAKVEEAKRAISGLRDAAAEWRTLAEHLANFEVREQELKTFTFQFLPEPPADVVSDRVRNNIDAARATFTKLYEESPTTDGHRGTALGLVDAATEYLDHLRGWRNRDTYMGRTMLRHEPLKAKAITLALDVVGASAS